MTTSVLIAALTLLVQTAKARPVDVSGAWRVTIAATDGKVTGEATLHQSEGKVTGQIGPTGDATIAIAGMLDGVKLTMKTTPAPGRTAAFETCELTVAGDRMTGTVRGGDVGKGTIEFVRKRP